MSKTAEYIDTHKQRFLDELFELLRIPTVSAQAAEHAHDMQRCAEWLSASLRKAGATRTEIFPTDGPPIVYSERIISPEAPTVLIYAHYDVMPVDPLDEWRTEPFEPVIKDGKIWGRGADDDKGQGFMHVKAFETLVATGTLNCNVKFMFEGEEEIGSKQITRWCGQHQELLKADIILVSDTSMVGMSTPSITCGLRGLAYVEVKVTGPLRDLHSGLYGGAVTNPVNALAGMLASLTDAQGRITVPGFYDDVRNFTPKERAAIARTPFDEKAFAGSIGLQTLAGGEASEYSPMERKGIRPTMDVCGIWGGYTGEGAKTIIPSTAHAKVSMRLVANQNFEQVTRQLCDHLQAIAPAGVTVECAPLHGGQPYGAPTDSAAYKAAAAAVRDTFGVDPLPFYSGGSIPIISTFEQQLGTKSILLGFGLDTDAIHSPNENFPLENFYKGIDTIIRFYHHFGK